jgi:hypothetical protein
MQDKNLNSSSAYLPSIELFEEGLRVRLELFGLDDQAICAYSAQASLDRLESHLEELQQVQLKFLLNDIRCLRWLKQLTLAEIAHN